ncbi:RlpA-like protein, double-psi beta-barrel domain [Cinara cedri]|uniref:RlpA-like protein, double-psi beta-barrel domain n=1 Tax=Cinara cedri TaxID=506608 RepID=A0A5E4MR74_9HEMI|nr:RlpA-like protein, double-psi beta-barrel domain [Cinara cedri]
MKEKSILTVALRILTVTISVLGKAGEGYASKPLGECKALDQICEDDQSCCSRYCLKPFLSIIWTKGICYTPAPTINDETYINAHAGICEFYKETDPKEIQYLNTEFNVLNAAHLSLPPYTRVEVWHNKYSVIVMINDRLPRSNGTLLDLSNEAAEQLGVAQEGFLSCRIQRITANLIIRRILFTAPIVVVIFGMVIYAIA